MIELRGNMEEGPRGLSFCLPFSSSRHMTTVEDLGKDSLVSGNLRMRQNVSTSSASQCQPMLLPNNEGRGHIGVSFTNCELRGPDQGMTSWRA